MSRYDDDRRPRHKPTRDRYDDYDDMSYDRDAKSTTIVRRRDDSVSSIEEVTRDFPPGDRGGAVYRETTVRKSGHRPAGTRSKSYDDDDYYDDRYSTYSRRTRRDPRDDDTYISRRSKKYDDRDDRRRHYDSYSDYSSRSPSPRPRKDKERRKSTTEEVLKSIGLGGVAGAFLGKGGDKDKDRSRSRSRSRDRDSRARSRRRRGSSSSSGSRSRGKSRNGKKERGAEALKAALLAGVVEAVRARKEPGGWGGEKGKRVLTAAVSAGGVDGILSHNRSGDHSTRDVIGSAVAGLATNRIVNGARSKSRGPDEHGRRDGSRSPDSRGRSQSRGGIGDLAAGGVLAATGKKFYDRIRSRSRGRARSRESSYDSFDSRRSPSRPKPERKRSSSVSAAVAKGLGAIGLGGAADKIDPERRKSKQYDDQAYDDRSRGYDDRSRGYDDYSNGGYRDSRDFR